MTEDAIMKANVSRPKLLAAYGVAICADFIQIGVLPITTEGFLSVVNDFLDIVTGIILTLLIGWHIAFLPSFFVKLIPVGDLAPTWTLAVFIASRGYRKENSSATPPIIGADDKAKVVNIEATEVKPPRL